MPGAYALPLDGLQGAVTRMVHAWTVMGKGDMVGNAHTLEESYGCGDVTRATGRDGMVACLAHAARQPLLLAYIAAGVLLGPQMGFGLVTSEADIQVISALVHKYTQRVEFIKFFDLMQKNVTP